MISQLNPFISNDFDAQNAFDYTLLLSIGEETITYAVITDGTLMAFGIHGNSEFATPHTLKEAEHINYKQVIAGLLPRNFSIIPNELFQEDGLEELAPYLDGEKSDKILSQELDMNNHVIFNYNGDIYRDLTKNFPEAAINFLYKGWLKAIAKKSPFNETVYLDVKSDCVHIANFKEQKLRFYNRYAISDENDLVYFAALVADELALPKDDILLSVSGNVENNDAHIRTLKEFFRQVEINKINPLEHLPEDAQPQQLLTLLALQLCV